MPGHIANNKILHGMLLRLAAAVLLEHVRAWDDVSTHPTISGLRGSTVELPCKTKWPVHTVVWYRYSSLGATEPGSGSIVARKLGGPIFNEAGPRFVLTPTNSLVVRNLSIVDETTYSCFVTIQKSGGARGYTNLTVRVLAEPTVDHCNPTSEGECTYMVDESMGNSESLSIVCRVSMVRPAARLSWAIAEGDVQIGEDAREETPVQGGLTNKSLSIRVREFEDGHVYKCLAEGCGVNGSSEIIVRVERLVPVATEAVTEAGAVETTAPLPDNMDANSLIAVMAISLIMNVVLIALLGLTRWKYRSQELKPRKMKKKKTAMNEDVA